MMRLKSLIAVGAVLALAACSSNATDDGSAGGSGSTSATSAPVTTAPSAGVSSQRLGGNQARPGSSEDFVVNVGDRVFFGYDRFDLTPEARQVLENQATWLNRYPQIRVTVAGHADERGTREYNLALGERRANSAKDYLIALGVDPNRIETITFGKERPVDPRSTEDAWAKNRRAVTQIDERSALTN